MMTCEKLEIWACASMAPQKLSSHKTLAVVFIVLSYNLSFSTDPMSSVVVRVCRGCFVMDEEVCVQAARDGLEHARHLFEIEKFGEIAGSARIGEVERTLGDSVVLLEEP